MAARRPRTSASGLQTRLRSFFNCYMRRAPFVWKNAEGYPDPTAGAALERIDREERQRRRRRRAHHMSRKEFYKSPAWKRCRKAYIDRRYAIDGGLCEVCHEELGLIVHHKIWLTDENVSDPDVALNFKNLRYECQTCHNREKDPSRGPRGRITYGPNGEIQKAGDW